MYRGVLIWLVAAAAIAATGPIEAQAQDAQSSDAQSSVAQSPDTQSSDVGSGNAQSGSAQSQEGQSAGAQSADEAKPYTVECGPDPEGERPYLCLVDRGTYVGWRTFHSICHTCHAQDAVGSTFAPDLLERMRQIDKAEFMSALNNGFEGQVGVMPPWKQDPNVNKYFEELWSYLLARADGVLLAGRPKRLPDPQ